LASIKKDIFNLLAVSVAIICCQKRTADTPAANAADKEKATLPATPTCYAAVSGNDTIRLQLITTDSLATGKLEYKLFEKDRNQGTIQGHFVGDTLFAAYTFQSEGVQSVREVAFLRQGNKLVEGFGEVAEKDGIMLFTNRGQLQFASVVLEKGPCAGEAAFSVRGMVDDIERGKDGYMAFIKATDGKMYQAVISRVNMAGNSTYQQLNLGDSITVYGDTTGLGHTISIKVNRIEKQ